MAAKHITKQFFLEHIWDYENNPSEWVYKGSRPALVDFFAQWCGPCKMLSPVLDELADVYAGKVDIYKVDTGSENELAEAFQIRSIPSLLFCPLNGLPQMAHGAMPKDALKQAIEDVLLK